MAFDPVKLSASQTPQNIAACGDYGDDWIIFEISSPSGDFSTVPQSQLNGTETPPANICYYDFLTDHKVTIAKGVPITQAGVYGIFAPAMKLLLLTSAGTANCNWQVPK